MFPVPNFTEIRPDGAALIHADRLTDGLDEVNRSLSRLRERS